MSSHKGLNSSPGMIDGVSKGGTRSAKYSGLSLDDDENFTTPLSGSSSESSKFRLESLLVLLGRFSTLAGLLARALVSSGGGGKLHSLDPFSHRVQIGFRSSHYRYFGQARSITLIRRFRHVKQPDKELESQL